MKVHTQVICDHPVEADKAVQDEIDWLTPVGWTVTNVEIGDWESTGSVWDKVERRNVRWLRADVTITMEDQR